MPEYPPGADPEEIIRRPLAKKKAARSGPKVDLKVDSELSGRDQEGPIEEQEPPPSPPLPAIAARMRKASLPSIHSPEELEFRPESSGRGRSRRSSLEERSSLTSEGHVFGFIFVSGPPYKMGHLEAISNKKTLKVFFKVMRQLNFPKLTCLVLSHYFDFR